MGYDSAACAVPGRLSTSAAVPKAAADAKAVKDAAFAKAAADAKAVKDKAGADSTSTSTSTSTTCSGIEKKTCKKTSGCDWKKKVCTSTADTKAAADEKAVKD